MRYKSKPYTVKNLEKLYKSYPSMDSITLKEAYESFGRDLTMEDKNKRWITNLMTHLKYYNLIKPDYSSSPNGKRLLSGFTLTLEGKRALGRIDPSNHINGYQEFIYSGPSYPDGNIGTSVKDVMKAVAKLREENPEFDIVFDIKLKG